MPSSEAPARQGLLDQKEQTRGCIGDRCPFLGLTALFNFLNERFIRLQQTIGFMMIALDGWEAGVDADVTVVDIGATGSPDTTTAQSPVIGFNFGEEGLMAGVSVKGTKVTKLDL